MEIETRAQSPSKNGSEQSAMNRGKARGGGGGIARAQNIVENVGPTFVERPQITESF
eukprot:COSAG04_NODE_6218_length_1381_cov_2.324493_1_plen_56_part_10